MIHSLVSCLMIISGKRLQRRHVDPPITKLPVELLCRIFELGVTDSYADCLSAFEHPPNTSEMQGVLSSTQEGILYSRPAFEISVSHVCKHWRDVALSTPDLWQVMVFNGKSSIVRNKRYLERSGNAPLDILIAQGPAKILRSRQRLMTTAPWDSSIGDDFDMPKALDMVFSLVRSSLPRWRTFAVSFQDYRSVTRLLSFFNANPPTSLRTVSVNYYGRPRLGPFIWPVPIEHERVPSPETLFLRAVALPWNRLVPRFFNNVQELHLLDIEARTYPKLSTLKEIVQLSPCLKLLRLENSDRYAATMISESVLVEEDIQPVHVPSLRNVTMVGLGYRYTAAALRLFDAPEAISLTFDCKGEVSNNDFLLRSISHSCSPLLRGIRTLSLVGAKCSPEAAHLFLAQLENVESLQLSGSVLDVDRFFRALLDNSDGFRTPYSRPPFNSRELYCPRLQEIRTEGVPLKWMAMFAEARLRGRHPLKVITIRARARAPDQDSKLWLRRNVEVFEHLS